MSTGGFATTRLREVGDAARPAKADEQLYKVAQVGIEVRTPTVILTAKELRPALGVTRLPRHMCSIPTVQIPGLAKSPTIVDTEQAAETALPSKSCSVNVDHVGWHCLVCGL